MKIKNIFILAFFFVFSDFVIAQQSCDPLEDCNAPQRDYTLYWYWEDADGDGVGNNTAGICSPSTTPPQGYSVFCYDCNDDDENYSYLETWYPDNDCDGYGFGQLGIESCGPPQSTPPGGGCWANNNYDCDDNDEDILNNIKWYVDADGDGYGNPNSWINSCVQPSGYVANGDDCDDTDPNITTFIFYRDEDGDGFGNPNISVTGCTAPSGYVSNALDCNDGNYFLNPNTNWYPDNDGDGYGNHNASPIIQCSQPPGYVYAIDLNSIPPHIDVSPYIYGLHDCNDNNAAIHPGTIWYLDDNGDGFGDPEEFLIQCEQPTGYVLNITPVQPIPEDPLPTYPGLNINDLNFSYTVEPRVPVSTVSQISALDIEEKSETISYFDGLGRPMQQIAYNAGGFEQDIVQYVEYDRFGRNVKNYLPYGRLSTVSGYFDVQAKNKTQQFYTNAKVENSYVATQDPFSESVFERSPHNRVKRQGNPGNSWKIGSGHEVEFDYTFNIANDVKHFKVALNSSFIPSLIDDGSYYGPNELTINIVKDENWVSGLNNTIEEFKNKEGLVVLKRNYIDGVRVNTYYVYDDYNNLTYILPPKSEPQNGTITQTVLNELCYQYRYDGLRRQIAKRIPGVNGWERVVYDDEDRPVLVQDPNLAQQGKWLFSKYDKFGRIVYTGIYESGFATSREVLQEEADQWRLAAQNNTHNEVRGQTTIGDITIGYSNQAFPVNDISILTVTYYDDYNFYDPDKPTSPVSILNQSVTTNVKGIAVASWTRTIDANTWNKSYSWFDEKARPLRTHNKNHLGGYTIVDSEIDFTGKPLKSVTAHKRVLSDNEMLITDRYVYDQSERLKAQYQKVNNNTEKLINGFLYDAIGQLHIKYVEPEDESFGYELVPAPGVGTSGFKNTFDSQEVSGNWQAEETSDVKLDINNKKLEIGYYNTGDAVKGYFDLEQGETYTISLNIDLTNFNSDLEFSIWNGSSKLYFEPVLHSGTFIANFTPVQTGSHFIQFEMTGSNPSSLGQEVIIDNVVVQKGLDTSQWVLQVKEINALQKIDYKYNARGMVTHVNETGNLGDDVFAYQLNYDVIESSGGIWTQSDFKPMFNGNIAQVIWQSASDQVKRDYKYAYDSFNRLKKASFSDSDFDLNQVNYDKGGNITGLNRNLQNGNHNFLYQYDGNQVHSINGTQTINGQTTPVVRSYSYDANGNMITDSSKGVSLIEYNYLSLPERVVFTNGQSIEYDYTASGVKLQKRYLANGQTMTTDYINGFQYENGELLFFGQPEGYVVHTVATNGIETNQYVHNFTDHLGNVRISYTDLDGSGSIDLGGEIVKERNYYPFGLQHQGYNNVEFPLGTMFKYGFGGKELQEENGIAWMDFGSRNYDAELGRWFNVDPQAERYVVMSPYGAMGNNPIMYVDPDGEFLVAAIVAGAIINVASTAISNPKADFGDLFGAAIKGAATGAMTYGIGQLGHAGLQMAAHGMFQGAIAAAEGGSFLQGAAIGAASSGVASLTTGGGEIAQMAMGAFTGGAIAEITGGNFVEGFATGLTVSALNHALHEVLQNIKIPPDPSKMDSRYSVEGKQWKKIQGRWTIVNDKKEILQWDSKKGEVEVYKGKKHQGGFDPNNRNKQISKQVKGRTPNGGWKLPSAKHFNKVIQKATDVIEKATKINPILNFLEFFVPIIPLNDSFSTPKGGGI